jgi:gliding motility-associated-like protein
MDALLTGADILTEDPPCSVDGTGLIEVLDTDGGTGPFSYSLDGILFQNSPLFEGLLPGMYTVIIRDDNGCEWEETVTINESEVLILNIGPDIEILANDHRNLSATVHPDDVTIDSVSWSPAEYFSCTNCLNPTFTVGSADTFLVTAIVFSGDCFARDTFLVSVLGLHEVYIPNVFSPNEDLLNDYITVFSPDKQANVLLFEIYDRWGNNVFWKTDFPPNLPKLGWDGYQNGRPMRPGVFAYRAEVEFSNGLKEFLTGTITLLR